MIATTQNLPYVCWNGSRRVPLSEGWLAESIYKSAEDAGMANWQLSAEVARAIAYYLRNDFRQNVITVDTLREIIARSLYGIGYPQIAKETHIVAPRVSIYLPDIARQAPYELEFFPVLKGRLQEAVSVVVQGIRLEGLRRCVKIISSRQKWRTNCQILNDEIVFYTRSYLLMNRKSQVELVIQ